MLKHRNIPSWLPIFPGFYQTIFEADEEAYIEDGKSVADYEWNYAKYHVDMAKEVTEEIQRQIPLQLGIHGVTIIFEALQSPKEYNFSTDNVNVTFKLTHGAVKDFNNYLLNNLETFIAYLKEHYTSRAGFASFYSTDYTAWFNEYLRDKNKLENCFGSVLQFMFENEGYDYEKLYYAVEGNVILEGELK